MTATQASSSTSTANGVSVVVVVHGDHREIDSRHVSDDNINDTALNRGVDERECALQNDIQSGAGPKVEEID